ncbi:MAG TPA: glycerophosphodiester phosphodiesterase family protein [Novosphingobium sp.]|nr:glycerophosphodiester phosphodiesterase family protein [Novosphingobium sp.]
MKLIAQRGVAQQFERKGVTENSCTATRIEKPAHDFVENTVTSLQQATRLGANMVLVDVTATADGRLVLFRDWSLDCRTDGKGPVAKLPLSDVQMLDAGYGYTADGGRSFPLRYNQTARIPTVEEAVAGLPSTPILFSLKGRTAADGALLVKALKAAGRDPAKRGDGFTAPDEAALAPLRQAFPGAWSFSPQSARECASRYKLMGWFTLVPEACKNGAIFVPLDGQWAYPGWPDRMLDRMAKANVRIILTAPRGEGEGQAGLDLPEQIAQVPFSYTGYVWVDDIWTMGPAFQPAANRRGPEAEFTLQSNHTARRKARGLPEPQ